jgi:hypothetical protein
MRRQSHSSKVKTIREEFIERGECGWRKNIKREEEGRGGRKEKFRVLVIKIKKCGLCNDQIG